MLGKAAENGDLHGANRLERRAKRRFKIQQDVRYKLLYGRNLAETGTGRTVEVSSSGVYFTTETTLAVGLPVELSMQWPALLNDTCPMKLMIYGCVVRSDANAAAITIDRYEFRTSAARTFAQVAARQAPRPPAPLS